MFSARRFVCVRSPTSRDLGIGVAALETFTMGTANLPPVIRRRTWRQRLRSIEWCCRGDTACRQNSASPSAAVAVASTGALRSMGRASGRRSNEPKLRLHRICQLAFLFQPVIVASTASDSDRGLAAPADRRKSRTGNEESRVGSLDRSCLSAPRRAQYFFSGSG